MLSFNSLLIFSNDPENLLNFYKKVFDVNPEWEEGEWAGFKVGTGYIMIGPHDKIRGRNKNPHRMIFNLETENVPGEFARIKGYDTKVVAKPFHPEQAEHMWIATFEDPDGNYFQLVSPMR